MTLLPCVAPDTDILQPNQRPLIFGVRVPRYAIVGQTVHMYCNFLMPPEQDFYTLKWFRNGEEIYRLVPEAKRELKRLVFNTGTVKIDIESSKMIGKSEHLLVLQQVERKSSGIYKCQITADSPPFHWVESGEQMTVMVLPERLPVISGLQREQYIPGQKVNINCTSSQSYPAAHMTWFLNKKKADRWMLTSYLPKIDSEGLETSTLGLSFLVLPDHFRGPGGELWVQCRASMPSIQGVALPLDRTLLLGTLSHKDSHRGGWSTNSVPGRCGLLKKMLASIVTYKIYALVHI